MSDAITLASLDFASKIAGDPLMGFGGSPAEPMDNGIQAAKSFTSPVSISVGGIGAGANASALSSDVPGVMPIHANQSGDFTGKVLTAVLTALTVKAVV